MDINQLVAVGLSSQEASTYLYLMENGQAKPSKLASELKLSRTNAYKLLDKLVARGLATKQDSGKLLAYSPANPTLLATLVAKARSAVESQEDALRSVMSNLVSKYDELGSAPLVKTATGRSEVADLYHMQINLNEDISFIHSPIDVPIMGFDIMDKLRLEPARSGNQRQAIMFIDGRSDIKLNLKNHERSNLNVLTADHRAYNSPVEWSATKSSLLIVRFNDPPSAIFIQDRVIAGAFLELFQLIRLLAHKPRKANLATANRKK